MDNVYLLLRNNQESGPFTFDELMQQKLNSHDLIWVEGKSMSWSYPSEIEELNFKNEADKKAVSVIMPKATESKNLHPAQETVANIKIQNNQSLSPKKDLEKRAEEIRKRALAFKQNEETEPVLNVYNTSGYYKMKREIPVSYKSNKKLVSASQLVIVAIASVLTAGWLYGDWSFIKTQPGTTSSAVTTYTGNELSVDENAAKEVSAEASEVMPVVPVTDAALPVNEFKKGAVAVMPASMQTSVAETTVVKQQPQPAIQVQEPVQEVVQIPVVVKAEKEEVKPVVEKEPKAEPEEVEKKKKGFLRGLFKKKKNDDEQELEAN